MGDQLAQEAAGRPGAAGDRSPLAFFALVFALSVPFWLVGAATGWMISPDLPVSSFIWVCPVLAAGILVYRTQGAPGVSALLRRSFDFQHIRNKGWYLPALFLLPAIYVATALIARAAGQDVSFVLASPLAVIGWFLGFFVAGQCEELGWSGYALDPLQSRWTALGASLVLGSVWVAFHLVPLAQANRAPVWIAWWAVATLGLRVLFTWLFNNTGGSVFATVLFHSTGNLAQIGPFIDFGPGGYPLAAQRIAAVLIVATATIAVVIWGPRTLTRTPLSRSSNI